MFIFRFVYDFRYLFIIPFYTCLCVVRIEIVTFISNAIIWWKFCDRPTKINFDDLKWICSSTTSKMWQNENLSGPNSMCFICMRFIVPLWLNNNNHIKCKLYICWHHFDQGILIPTSFHFHSVPLTPSSFETVYEFSTALSSSIPASYLVFMYSFVICARYSKHLHVTRMQLWAENVIYFNAFMKVDQHWLSVNWLIFYALPIRSKSSFLGIKLSFMRVSMHDVCAFTSCNQLNNHGSTTGWTFSFR